MSTFSNSDDECKLFKVVHSHPSISHIKDIIFLFTGETRSCRSGREQYKIDCPNVLSLMMRLRRVLIWPSSICGPLRERIDRKLRGTGKGRHALSFHLVQVELSYFFAKIVTPTGMNRYQAFLRLCFKNLFMCHPFPIRFKRKIVVP